MVGIIVVKDINECERIWKKFSPNRTVFDLWENRICFYYKENFEPYFITAKEESEVLGVLPLWFDRDKKFYDWFGGEFSEHNTFFCKDKKVIATLIENTPIGTVLTAIDPSETKYAELKQDDVRFYIDLKECDYSITKYMETFSSKHRKNLRRDIQALEKMEYKINRNRLEDFNRIVELNKGRFKEESFFNDNHFIEGYKKMLELAEKKGELELISVEINKQIQSVEAGIYYNKIYTVLLGGNNLEILNIGKLMTLEHIKRAIELKADQIDFLSTDTGGWKTIWKMKDEPSYSLVR